MRLVSIADIQAAAKTLDGIAVRTPLLPSPWAEDLWFKPENLQTIGAFKLRGAYHAMARLPESVRARGVVTHSSGNHGRAVAWAARAFGVPATVVMPEGAPAVKVAGVSALDAEVVLVPPAQRAVRAEEIARSRDRTVIPPFDHLDVIAGQGTIGLEIAEDAPADLTTVLVPVGGGGLAAGVASAVKAVRPRVRVIGVEPELAADAQQSLHTGELVTWPIERTQATIADAVRVGPSPLTFAHLVARLDDIVTVTEEQILATVARLAREAKLVVEPGGALGVAAHLYRRYVRDSGIGAGRTVAVISGGNIAPRLLAELLTR